MIRLRDVALAAALAIGGVGCATFCDECDDFPVPGGPGGYESLPGSYTGPPLRAAPDPGPAAGASAGAGSPAAGAASRGTGGGENAPTPPAPPPAAPGTGNAVTNPR